MLLDMLDQFLNCFLLPLGVKEKLSSQQNTVNIARWNQCKCIINLFVLDQEKDLKTSEDALELFRVVEVGLLSCLVQKVFGFIESVTLD